jgi:hypothetical protein
LEISYSRGPKRAQKKILWRIEDFIFKRAQEGPRGPKKRFYRRLEISYSRGPKRAQKGPLGDFIEDCKFYIQEGPRGPKNMVDNLSHLDKHLWHISALYNSFK